MGPALARRNRHECEFFTRRFKCFAIEPIFLNLCRSSILIPLALLIHGGAVWAFFWAVGNGQFDDLDTPAMRILMDDDKAPKGGPDSD